MTISRQLAFALNTTKMTFLDLSFIVILGLGIRQVGCHAFETPTICTPEYEVFESEFQFTQTARDVQALIKTIDRTASSGQFTPEVIQSFKHQAQDLKNQLDRALGELDPRAKREAESGENIISVGQNYLGRVGNFIGVASKKNIDDLKLEFGSIAKDLESSDEKISTTLGTIKQSFNQGVRNFRNFLEKSGQKIEKGNDARWGLDVQLRSLLNHLHQMVFLLLEVRDRADQGLPSRLILDSAKVQDWIDRTSKKYHGHLFPIFDDPDSYFMQPLTDTTIADKNVIMKFVMPLQDHSEFFFKKAETKTLTLLESNTRIIQLTHRQQNNCHDSVRSIVCLLRTCRMNKFSDAIRACLITTKNTGEDVVELIYKLPFLQSQPKDQEEIILNCQGKVRKVFKVKKEIVQFTVPEFCESKNSHFDIQRVYTTNHSDISPNFGYKNFNLSEASKENFKSDVINDEIRQLVVETKHQEELNVIAKAQNKHLLDHENKLKTHKSTGYIVLAVFVPVIIIIVVVGGTLIYKKQQQMKSAVAPVLPSELEDMAKENVDTTMNTLSVCDEKDPPEYDFETDRILQSSPNGLD